MSIIIKLQRRIRNGIIFFISVLLLIGISTFPLENELKIIVNNSSYLPDILAGFISTVYNTLSKSNQLTPFMSYGYDWLAYAHLIIAILFIGPLRNPIKNIWVIEFGMIACILIVPTALICGQIREIPIFWQMIDCSFGVFGIIPLLYIHQNIKQLEYIINF